MIPDKIQLEILTPDRRVYSQAVSSVRLPGLQGYFGVHPGHTLFVAGLKVGEIKVQIDEDVHYYATSGGVAEVLPDSVSVLAEAAESAVAIDLERAQRAKERAQKRLEEGSKNWDVRRAKTALLRAINRIHIAAKA